MCQTQSDQINEIAKALAVAQAELEPAAKNAENPHLRNRYADLSAVYEAIRKVLPKHGLAVAQVMLPRDDGKAHVRTTLLHESGQWIAGECVMPCDKQGGIQGMGSAITYARRYSLSAIVGVVSEEDDDAEAATRRRAAMQREQARAANPNPMSEAQSKALMAYLNKRHGNDREAYCRELSDFFGRVIKSSRELTKTEVGDFLNAVAGEGYAQ